ncbi:MAG: hypothetical protein ACR2LK_15255 [Solirubrobacteraceae bacterium]
MLRLLPLTLLLCLLLSAPAGAASNQSLTFEAQRDLMDPATRPAALTELESLGVERLRVIMTWSKVAPGPDQRKMPDIEPSDPESYNWGEYDALMAAARQRGWPVLMTISGPVPKWATKARLDNLTRPRPSAFAAFTTAVGRKYGEQVKTWAIWNEPNQPQFLRPQYARGGRATSPRIYRQLYRAGVRGLDKAGQEDDDILIGETSPRGNSRVVAPLRFLRGMLCLNSRYKPRGKCGALDPDGYAHHAYTTRQGPSFVPRDRDDVTIGVLGRLTRALNRARRAKALKSRLPIHLTEFGIQSTPDEIQGVPLTLQVKYRAISERIAFYTRRVVAFSQYLLTDSDPEVDSDGDKSFPGFESGLRFADGEAKPSLRAFPLVLTVQRRGSKVSIWGLVRPAKGKTTATITYANKGAKRYRELRTVSTNSRGYFRFNANYRSGRSWNLEWEDPSGEKRTSFPVRAYKRR